MFCYMKMHLVAYTYSGLTIPKAYVDAIFIDIFKVWLEELEMGGWVVWVIGDENGLLWL